MQVIIIEDEPTAVKKLEDILCEISPGIDILVTLPSVREAVAWIRQNQAPDVGFFDIQLADDLSFQIFEQCEVNFPVIFTTAYDNYLLKAFEYHSIHYLLKPLQKEKVKQALRKVKELKTILLDQSVKEILSGRKSGEHYTNRFLVRKGTDFIPLESKDIAYFFTEHGLSFAHTFSGETFMIDQSLSDLETGLDKRSFFRANRQYLIQFNAILKFKSIEQSKIKLELTSEQKKEIIIGKQTAVSFRQWISGN